MKRQTRQRQAEVYKRDEAIVARSYTRATPAEQRRRDLAASHAHVDLLRSAIPKK